MTVICNGDNDRGKDALRRARNIISLKPIHKGRDVESQYRQFDHITTDDLSMKSTVIEYSDSESKCECLFPQQILLNMTELILSLKTRLLPRMYQTLPELSGSQTTKSPFLFRKASSQSSGPSMTTQNPLELHRVFARGM